MINFIKNYFKEQDEKRFQEDQRRHMQMLSLRKKELAETRELLRITNCNINYIKAYLNTLGSVANCTKGDTVSETRRKRQWVRAKIEWLNRKIEEELVMSHFYENKIKHLV